MERKIRLEILPEFFKSGLKMRGGKYLVEGDLKIPSSLFLEIENFCLGATRIYGMGEISKSANWDYLFAVDKAGYDLKLKLESLDFNVKYFSPGKNTYLNSYPVIQQYKKELNLTEKLSRLIFRIFYDRSWANFARGEVKTQETRSSE